MNMQGHLSGQFSGQATNQAGNQLPGLSQHNESSVSNRIPSLGGNRNTMNIDSEANNARRFVQEKIKEFIMPRQQNPPNLSEQRLNDIVKRIDETLWRSASSKEEYVNLDTLEKRLHAFINHLPSKRDNQQYSQQVNSSVGTMIPTPGMPSVGNSSIMAASSVGTSPMVPSVGSMQRGYQQSPANFGVGSSGNNVSSVGIQRMTGQMIPTPGFNSGNNQPLVNVNSSSGSGSFSNVESAMLSRPPMQRQHANSQTSRMLHNLGSHTSGGVRSGLLQKSYGYTDGVFNESSSMSQNNLQLLNGSGSSDGYLSGTQFGENTSRLFQQNFDQHPQPTMPGEGYRRVISDPSEHGNFYGTVSSSGAGTNKQNMKPTNLQSMSRTNSAMMVNGSNLLTPQQAVDMIPPTEQSGNMSYQALNLSQETLSLSHSQQQPYHLHQQLFQQQRQPKQKNLQHQDTGPSLSQTSQQVQPLMHTQQQIVVNSQNDFSSPDGMQSGSLNQTNWDTKFQDRAQVTSKILDEQNHQEDFRQRISGADLAHRNNLSMEQVICPTDMVTTTEPANSVRINSISVDPIRERQYRNQQRWVLLLLHARRCMAPAGNCQEVNCVKVQQLLKHINSCNTPQCKYPRCHNTMVLVKHRMHCRDSVCPVCVPVKNFIEKQLKARSRLDSNPGGTNSVNGTCEAYNNLAATDKMTPKMSPQVGESLDDLQISVKRVKMEQNFSSPNPSMASFSVPNPSMGRSPGSLSAPTQEHRHNDPCTSMKPELAEIKMEISSVRGTAISSDMRKDNVDTAHNQKTAKEPSTLVSPVGYDKKEHTRNETKPELHKTEPHKTEPSAENEPGTKSGKPKMKGVSLTELFTPEQVREHIRGLRQWVGQSKAKAEKNQSMEHSENSCQLCAVEKLTFEPPPIYCSPCGARIKRNAMYYTIRAGDTQHFFCIPCYNESRGESILVEGTAMPKRKMEKKKNDEETEEWWVECDKCKAWQHQICALFNGRRNDGGQADYICPNCYIVEVERGELKPLPQSAVLGAKDLPRTILSDHIEERLFKKLKQERQDRARFQGKSYDEVPGAEALVVRVVSSVDKKLEVKQRFLENFQEENYPTEFPYKSKVVLLFQKSEGVEVCLFAMYVQEFGSECQEPNRRRVYLSYLDSVKYFRPEIRTVTGEALRTYVYHEILIGYLDYCKKRGFTSCYIWACPPLKGEDYILYCHPEIQKTPKSDKLREWYLCMLRKASKENIVVDLTNLYDHFFISTGECKAKVTAARLPYFDGDYWPGAAEDMIYQLQQEEDGRKQLKKGTNKKTLTKRALKASGQSDLSGNVSKDMLLMHKLGETISPMKEDFIMVHLQHACSHCSLLMVFGNRWVCEQCKKFQLCDKCYEAEQQLEEKEKHPVNQRDKHSFYPVVIDEVPDDTMDMDEIIESEFFDTRQAFLSLCQGNHYQYDTLRRAKHSSMMVLYHLHNPTAPAFVITCCVCFLDIEAGQGWRCESCPEYDVCNSCYQKGGIDHPHELTNHPSMADRNAQNKEARQQRVIQLRKMLDLLVHASQCRSSNCQYPNCRKVKGLFRHGMQCRIRASGGCVLCKKMWELLHLHARSCKESGCCVPRCRDLREHMRRLQQQSDSRRRAAVMEMMRQRAAEVAGNSG